MVDFPAAFKNVAGVTALWLAHHLRHDLIRQVEGDTKLQFVFKNHLQKTAHTPPGWNKDEFGAGIVDAQSLLKSDPIEDAEVMKLAREDYFIILKFW